MPVPTDLTICFVVASGQNVFFDEMLDAMREVLDDLGARTLRAVDHFPAMEDDIVYVVVPHEFMPLTHERAHPSKAQLKRTIALCTEQPGTDWFEHAARVAGRCAATLDINPLGVAALRRRGIRARLQPFGYVPSWDHWGGDEALDRPVDLAFMGGHTQRRGAILARCGSFLDDRRASLHLTETAVPHTADSHHFLTGERKWRELARAKVLLNIHRDELGYFEWLRVVGAAANGCVVVTEHSLGCAPLVPGEHLISSSYGSLPHVVEALLQDEERLRHVRASAYAFLTDSFRLADHIHVLVETAAEVLTAAPGIRGVHHPATVPAPKEPPRPRIEYDEILAGQSPEQALRMGVKHLLTEQRRLQREVARLRDGSDGPELDERRFGPYDTGHPRVSVLLTVFNYAAQVPEALRSVATSTYRDLEVVVVDDASQDESVASIVQTLEDLPWLPVKLLARRHNAGLPRARNSALEHARGELVFILDADNGVLPHGIEKLVAALDADPGVSFAYGCLEKRTAAGPVDLVNWLGWNPVRLRYGNFVDAMALFRREALVEAGGYTTDSRLYGWEDFALWGALVSAGHQGHRIPEIVGHYTTAAHSMISLTNIDTAEAWSTLVRNYPFLGGTPVPPLRNAAARV